MTTATKAGGDVPSKECPECGGMGFIDGIGECCAGCRGTGIAADPRPTRALTPHAPAQATIDELRAEVKSLKAKQIDVEAVMRLADEWVVEAIHAALAANTGHTTLADPDAAREALRASLLGDGGTL